MMSWTVKSRGVTFLLARQCITYMYVWGVRCGRMCQLSESEWVCGVNDDLSKLQ